MTNEAYPYILLVNHKYYMSYSYFDKDGDRVTCETYSLIKCSPKEISHVAFFLRRS